MEDFFLSASMMHGSFKSSIFLCFIIPIKTYSLMNCKYATVYCFVALRERLIRPYTVSLIPSLPCGPGLDSVPVDFQLTKRSGMVYGLLCV